MKRYDLCAADPQDYTYSEECEAGQWVPASVAQALYDALDGLRSCNSVSLEDWLASGAEIALSLADGEDE